MQCGEEGWHIVEMCYHWILHYQFVECLKKQKYKSQIMSNTIVIGLHVSSNMASKMLLLLQCIVITDPFLLYGPMNLLFVEVSPLAPLPKVLGHSPLMSQCHDRWMSDL